MHRKLIKFKLWKDFSQWSDFNIFVGQAFFIRFSNRLKRQNFLIDEEKIIHKFISKEIEFE